MNHLLYFTIGPAQGFIAQARKTQDMFAGSKLLTDCIAGCIDLLPDHNSVIFPFSLRKHNINPIGGFESLPNRLLVELNDMDHQAAKEIARELEAFAQAFLRQKRTGLNVTYAKEKNALISFFKSLDKQLAGFLDIQWIITSLKPNESYQEAYNRMLTQMASTKYTRIFNQQHGQQHRKCSLSGEADALVFGDFYFGNDKDDNPKFYPGKYIHADVEKVLHTEPLLIRGEGLSGVQFVKRFSYQEGFPSTADIALMYFKNRFQKEIQGGSEKMPINYTVPSTDAQMLYEENYTLSYFLKHGKIPADFLYLENGERNKVEEKWRKKIEAKKKNLVDLVLTPAQNLSPSPVHTSYYAMLRFDGDNMGEWWKGTHPGLKSGIDLKAFHKELAEGLAKFGDRTRNILDAQHYGKVVFAGGDDFMGLICLQHLEAALYELREAFEQEVNDPLREQYFSGEKGLSYSGGLVITHYKVPLYEVVRMADDAQYRAKDMDEDKDAMAIEVLKHAGEAQQCQLKWAQMQAFFEITDLLVGDEVSTTFVFRLSEELLRVAGNEDDYLVNTSYFKAIVKRLLVQTYGNHQKETTDALMAALEQLLDATKGKTGNFLHSLHVIEFLQRQLTPQPQNHATPQT